MSRGPSAFRQRDVVRLIKAATAAGLHVTGARVGKDGAIEVVTGESAVQDSNPWDKAIEELKQ